MPQAKLPIHSGLEMRFSCGWNPFEHDVKWENRLQPSLLAISAQKVLACF